MTALLLGARVFFSPAGIHDAAVPPTAQVPECEPPAVLAPEQPVLDNVWLGLTVNDVVDIREWLLDSGRGLNLTRGEHATIKYAVFLLSAGNPAHSSTAITLSS